MNDEINVILASGSPRRKELLKMLYADFRIFPTDTDESIPDGLDVYEVAEYLSVKKAKSIKANNALVIACDTVVIADGKILGKPESCEDAVRMLSTLSGKVHDVVTGVCLSYNNRTLSFSQKTSVEFYELSQNEISAYVMTGEPMDKAGAYGIQGLGSLFVKKIDGDFYNVVGLPVARLKREINLFLKAVH